MEKAGERAGETMIGRIYGNNWGGEEVEEVINRINTGKAGGEGNIAPEIIKEWRVPNGYET